MEAQLRKHQTTLIIIGTGVIVFGLWSVVKVILYHLLASGAFQQDTPELFLENFDDYSENFFTIGVLIIDLICRLYVGHSARSEGSGQRRGKSYVVVAGLLSLYCLFSIVFDFYAVVTEKTAALQITVSLLIEITSLIMFLELMFAAIQIRRLTGKITR